MSAERALELMASGEADQVQQGLELLLALGQHGLNHLAWRLKAGKKYSDLCLAVNRHRHAGRLPAGEDIDKILLGVLDQWGDLVCQKCSGDKFYLVTDAPEQSRRKAPYWVPCPDCTGEE
jgi:hypothetical protein